jgi:hypothetical protein
MCICGFMQNAFERNPWQLPPRQSCHGVTHLPQNNSAATCRLPPTDLFPVHGQPSRSCALNAIHPQRLPQLQVTSSLKLSSITHSIACATLNTCSTADGGPGWAHKLRPLVGQVGKCCEDAEHETLLLQEGATPSMACTTRKLYGWRHEFLLQNTR